MKLFLINGLLLFHFVLFSQPAKWPVILLPIADTSGPFVFYFSGDGGWNNFSSSLAETINKNGYAVAGVNSKSYFWEKKTVEQATNDLTGYLQKELMHRKNQQWILAGYSFGADVIPFIVNSLPLHLKNNLQNVILLSPSASTDFEVHWSDLLDWNKKRSMDVTAEINKMGMQKTIIIAGDNEKTFPVKDIKLKNLVYETLPGGHHFEGNTREVAETMMKHFK